MKRKLPHSSLLSFSSMSNFLPLPHPNKKRPFIRPHASVISEESFRNRLVEHENELIVLREENARLKNGWDNDKKRMRELESRLVNAESANTSLQRRVDAFCEAKVVLENEVRFNKYIIDDRLDWIHVGLTSCELINIPLIDHFSLTKRNWNFDNRPRSPTRLCESCVPNCPKSKTRVISGVSKRLKSHNSNFVELDQELLKWRPEPRSRLLHRNRQQITRNSEFRYKKIQSNTLFSSTKLRFRIGPLPSITSTSFLIQVFTPCAQ